MRSEAKASTAGSTQRQIKRLGIPITVFAAIFATMALLAAPAGAVKVHLFKEVFGSAAQPTFGFAAGMAVDSSGDLLVMDGEANGSNTGTISRFNPDGTPDDFAALGANVIDGQGTGDETPQNGLDFGLFPSSEAQIAVDTSGGPNDGNIYVTQASPALINVFSEDGEYLGQLTAAGVTDFTKTCGVAVDPSGVVYVGDHIAGIHKFVPAANPPVNADHTATFSSVAESCTLAAGVGPTAGYLFAASYRGPISKIDSATGELKYVVFGGQVFTIYVNPADGHLFSSGQEEVNEFDASGATGASTVATIRPPEPSTRGVAAKGASDIYVNVAALPGEAQVQVYDGAVVSHPDVTTEAASDIEPTAARINGKVNPDGEALTECLFEVGPPKGYGESVQTYTETVPCVPNAAGVGSGTSPVAVHADISGLGVASVHHYRLKAANAHGPILGTDASFQATGPRLIGAWAEDVALTEAMLKAAIDPEESATTYRFEWGETAAYGNVSEGSAGSDSEPHEATVFLEGLKPGTTYHYRVLAINGIATSESPDLTFTTYDPFVAETDCANQANRYGASAALPDCRAYEMVSPVDKGGASIYNRFDGSSAGTISYEASNDQAALDGDKLAYTSYKPFGDAQGSYWANQYIATRGAGGWSSHGISPPQEGNVNGIVVAFDAPKFNAFSEDLSLAFLLDNGAPALTPDAAPDLYNAYLRDNRSGTYTALTTELSAPAPNPNIKLALEGHSDDWSHVVFNSTAALTPEAASLFPLASKVYDYSGGEVRLVSILPGGGADSGVAGAPDGVSTTPTVELGNTQHAVSEDGSRIFWTADGSQSAGRI